MKRIVVFLVIAALLVPWCCSTCVAASNPFSRYDEQRDRLIAAANGEIGQPDPVFLAENEVAGQERYIVKFRETATLAAIYAVVRDIGFELLADSSERLFLIKTDDIASFSSRCAGMTEYIEADTNRALESHNDTYYSVQWQYDYYDFDSIYATGATGGNVTVAILDSGINRNHTDLAGVTIAAGFNAVSGVASVNTDIIGHGTAVAGIIAAVADNGRGVAGICKGVTIVPVVITRNDGNIFSADFIKALYFAADSGADIINMSFGGTDKLSAEQDAVDYAFGKGCLLIGASGNFEQESGERDEYFYPASYEHVLSVASFGKTGGLSLFSRYNDMVDTCAPGENVYVIYGTTNNAVIAENGTSFAAPFVSAVAALALSVKQDNIRVTSDDFRELVASTAKKQSGTDCGNIDPLAVINGINSPIVTGISNGGVYYKNVKITYNLGSATLDGEPFASGTTVKVNGLHTLILKYGEDITEYSFVTDNLPLTFSAPEGDSLSSPFAITFSRGTATLNGIPYYSGKTISESGYYSFVLTGPNGNTAEKSFTLYTDLPTLYGVTNGGVYSGAVELKLIGDGSVTVGKKSIHSGETMLISEPGSYTATLRNVGGTQTQSVAFTVDNRPLSESVLTFAGAKLILDEARSNLIVYGDGLYGVRVYDAKDVSSMLRYVTTDSKSVLAHASAGTTLALMHTSSVTVMDMTKLRSGEPLRGTVIIDGKFTAVASDGTAIYAVMQSGTTASLVKINTTTFKTENICAVPSDCDSLAFSGLAGTFYAYSTLGGEVLTVCDVSARTSASVGGFGKGNLLCAGSALCVGDSIYNNTLKRTAVSDRKGAIGTVADCFFTKTELIDSVTGASLGKFASEVSDVALASDKTAYIVYSSMKLVSYKNGSGTATAEALRTAPVPDGILGANSSTSVYASHTAVLPSLRIIDWVHDSAKKSIYLIAAQSHRLYIISDSLDSQQTVVLNEQPAAIHLYNGVLYVAFENSARLFIYRNGTGSYLNLTSKINPTEIVGTDKLYCLSDGNIVTVSTKNGVTNAFTHDREGSGIGFEPVSQSLYLITATGDGYYLERYNAISGTRTSSAPGAVSGSVLICDGTYVYGGTSVYDAATLDKAGVLSGAVYGSTGDFLLTGKGIYDKTQRITVPIPSLESEKMLFSDKYEVFLFTSSGNILKLSNPDGVTPSAGVEITLEGTAMGEDVYEGAVKVNFPTGYGYVDGHPLKSGATVSDGGAHTLTVVLSYGNTVTRKFTINPVMSGITLSGPSSVDVNGKISLVVSFTPAGISELPVVFTSDNPCVYVDKSGTVYGLTPGTAKITVSTEDGRFTAVHTVISQAYKLKFTNSRFRLTDDGTCVVNIAAGTTVKSFLSYVDYGSGSAKVTRNGATLASGDTLCTGDTLTVVNSAGNVAGACVSVRGDADCDGLITPADLVAVNRHIYSKQVLAGECFHAADTTLDSKVNLSDLLLISSHLAGESTLSELHGLPARSVNAKLIPSFDGVAAKGNTIVLSVSAYDLNAGAFSGELIYDASVLEFVSADTSVQKWRVVSRNDSNGGKGVLRFVAYDENLKQPLNRENVIFTVTFRVTENAVAGNTVSVEFDSVMCDSGSVADETASFVVDSGESQSRLSSLTVENAVMQTEFLPNVFIYRMTVPFDTENAVITALCANENANVTLSDTALKPDEETQILISVDAGGGDITVYRLYVTRLTESAEPSGEARLESVTVNGGTLRGEFDPDVYEYDVTLDADTVDFSATPVDAGTTYEIKPTGNGYEIICTAEDGTSVMYVFNVITYSPESSSPEISETSGQPGIGEKFDYVVGAAIAGAAIALAVALIIILRKRKKNNVKENS